MTSAAPRSGRRTRRAQTTADCSPATVCLTFAIAVPRSVPSRLAVTTMSRCRFSRRISFCGGRCSTVANEPSVAVWPDALLNTVFSIASSDARCSSPSRTRIVYCRPLAISGAEIGMPSRIEVASCETSSGVKPSREATLGSIWKFVAGPLMVFSMPFSTSTTPGIFPMASPTRGPSCVSSCSSFEKILIWIGSGAFERSLILSCRIWVSSISSSGSVFLICRAHVVHHVPHRAAAIGLSASP